MFGLSTGTVYGRSGIPPGGAKLLKNNTQQARVGSKLLLLVGGKKLYLNVTAITDGDSKVSESGIQDDIIISAESGFDPVTGSYKRISDFRYSIGRALGTKKGRATAFYTLGSICSAALASIAASQKEQCTGLGCVKWYTWSLIALTALLSSFAWYKDNAL